MSSSKTRASDRLGGIPPKPPIVTMRTTRSNAPLLASKEDIINQPFTVRDTSSGKTYLEEHLLVPVGEPYDNNLLAATLLHITQLPNLTKPAAEAIRAVAFILTDLHGSDIAEAVANKFIVAISPKLATLHKATTDLESTIDLHKQHTTNATSTLDQIRNSASDIANRITANLPCAHSQDLPANRTYSEALKTGNGNAIKVHEALRRADTRARQILITPTGDRTLFTEDDTNESIAQKLQTTLDTIRANDDPTITVKAVILLHNKGLLFEVNSIQAADWIRRSDTKDKLLGKLDVPAEIRDRHYSVIVPYVPTSFRITDNSALNKLESDNDIPQDSIISARWIKPIERRAPGQKSAYAIFSFSAPEHANTLIRDGMILNKEKLHPRKDKREPVRCVRCQKWGHIARTCKAQNDICGTCGNTHRTDACNNSKNIFCTNCKSGNHPSHSRECPEFAARCEQFNNNNPENQMPYYPTDAPWTQALLPPKLAPFTRHQTAFKARNPTFRQTTLDINAMGIVKPPTQRAQKNMYPNRTQAIATGSNGIPINSQPHLPPSPAIPARSPTPPPRSPDDSFHSTSSDAEFDRLILNYELANE